jgi:hypothetical protein
MSDSLKIGDLGCKGGPGGECARTVCRNRPAIGYNRSTGLWYCIACSDILNRENALDAMKLYGGPLVIIAGEYE